MAAGFILVVVGLITLLWGHGWEVADRMASVFSMFIGLAALALGFWQARRAPAAQPATLTQIVEGLAARSMREWQHEEAIRRIHDPAPLPVCWKNADEALCDHWLTISRGSRRTPIDLSGSLSGIDKTFASVPSRRLVVLGRGGSGKTILTLRFVLDRLKDRRRNDPVPVVFSVASWNPSKRRLRLWLADRLALTYPPLATILNSQETVAEYLLNQRRILPVLDGFDEIATGLRIDAIKEINLYCGQPDAALLLTSRPTEYRDAVRKAGPINGAAVVQLMDLTLDDLADYLPRTTKRTTRREERKWQSMLHFLYRRSVTPEGAAVAKALSTPLMVSLARAIYSDTDRRPTELAHISASTSGGEAAQQDAVEEHLLGQFVPAVYSHEPFTAGGNQPRTWQDDDIRRWLTFLARHVRERGIVSVLLTDSRNQTTDLAWWQLHRAAPRDISVLTVLLGPLVAAGTWFIVRPALGIVVAIVACLILGLTSMATVSTLLDTERTPVQARLHLDRSVGSAIARGMALGASMGLPLGIGVGLASGLTDGMRIVVGVGLGLGVGISLLLIGNELLTSSIDIDRETSPRSGLDADRITFVIRAPFSVLAGGLGAGLAVDSVLGATAGPITGGLVGLFTATIMTCQSAWPRYKLVHLWLVLRGRLPLRLFAFLADAHRRGIFRQAGAVYHFRHARLQHRLATGSLVVATTPEPTGRPPSQRRPSSERLRD
jgi:hypothetical protein